MGRLTTFTEAQALLICERIAGGESLRTICSDETTPAISTVMKWLNEQPGFSEQYARARETQADVLAEEILQIADDGRNDTYKNDNGVAVTDHDVIARSRLRVDARKWLASKMAPKKYGEKIEHAHGGSGGLPITHRIERVIVESNSNKDS